MVGNVGECLRRTAAGGGFAAEERVILGAQYTCA
jgi:hypothetical protein